MKRELIFFRSFLLISLASIFGFGAFSGYCFYERRGCQRNVDCILRLMYPETYSEDISMPGEIKLRSVSLFLKEELDSWVIPRNKYHHRAWLFLHLAYILPIMFAFCFYGIRYVILGRLRPLWPREI